MGTDSAALGTKWLKFWTYVGLPVITIVLFLVALDLPRFRYENIPISIFCVAIALGLHRRKLWAWQLNWLVLALIYVAMLIPVPIRDFNGSFPDVVAQGAKELISMQWTRDSLGDLAMPIAIRLVLASLVWLWPNWVYWRKRAGLFS